MAIMIGDQLPNERVRMMEEDGPEDVYLADLFSNKRIILFAVPGAFTGTCSTKHLPGFLEEQERIKKTGIDLIACLSVNDVFVMDAWAKSQNVGNKILMLADGNADFTQSAGLVYDARRSGMGMRSLRYVMIIDNCVVKNLFIDQPKKFESTSAESIAVFLESL